MKTIEKKWRSEIMKKELLKGETTILVKKIKENKDKVKKSIKKTPKILFIGFPIGFICLFVIFPSLTEAKPYILKLFLVLFAMMALLSGLIVLKSYLLNKQIIKEAFTGNKRIVENIHAVYEDDHEMRAMMEVLCVGCDMEYKEDKKKVDKVIKRLLKDIG